MPDEAANADKTSPAVQRCGAWIGGAASLFLIGWGLLLVLVQCLYWLKNGQWVSVSLLDLFLPKWQIEAANLPILPLDLVPGWLFNGMPWLIDWLSNPHGWLGLHRLVTWILGLTPLSLALVVMGFAIAQ